MSTTKDPQSNYGEQPKREPFLSDEDIDGWIVEDGSTMCSPGMTDKEVRDFYEDMITEGRLMVVKTAKGTILPNDEWYPEPTLCNTCGTKSMSEVNGAYLRPEFCTKCGDKIVE